MWWRGDETALKALNPPFDIIIASDLFAPCYKEHYQDLIQTLVDASNTNTLILFAYEKRDFREVEFFQELNRFFSYSKVWFYQDSSVSWNASHLLFFFVKVPNSQLDEVWQSEDIGIFVVKKRNWKRIILWKFKYHTYTAKTYLENVQRLMYWDLQVALVSTNFTLNRIFLSSGDRLGFIQIPLKVLKYQCRTITSLLKTF